MSSNTNTAAHRAAVCTAVGTPLSVSSRPTPTPGPGQVLVRVHATALNIVDVMVRDSGFLTPNFPAIPGCEVSGTIVATSPRDTIPKYLQTPGTRITAFTSAFHEKGYPDFGAFQEMVLIPTATVTPIPDGMGWAEAVTMPTGVHTALAAWDMVGLDYISPDVGKNKDKAILIWGAASGIATMALQTAKLMGYTVIAVASERNHEYLRGLGADVVFDYHDKQEVEKKVLEFVSGRKGMEMKVCFLGAGDVTSPQAILKELNGENGGSFIAHAPFVPPGLQKVDGVEVKFVRPEEERGAGEAQRSRWFNVYLREKLASGELRHSPEVKLVGETLENIDVGLTELRDNGVRCAKPVVLLK